MKKIFVIGLCLCGFALSGNAQKNDPVVMNVAGQPVYKSEFVYEFNKNNTEGAIDKKTPREYAELFANYKLKVQAALDARMDTVAAYQKEFRTYRDQQLRTLLLDTLAEEKELEGYYNQMAERIGEKGLIRPAHILVLLRQDATPEQQALGKARIDSLYAVLQKGGDFETLARECSDDKASARNGGLLQWVGPGQTLPEFEEAAYALQPGQMSGVVSSPVGYHIILMKERKALETYAQLRPQIKRFLEQRGLKEHLIGQQIQKMLAESPTLKTEEALMDSIAVAASAQDEDLANLIREYHDGLLLYDISNQHIWEKAAKDENALEKYFKKNKKQYTFDKPRYKGMVFYCSDEADVAKVKKCLKGKKYEEYVNVLRQNFNTDSTTKVKVDRAIFQEGQNANIDKLVFGKGDGKPMKKFPYMDVYGKLLKKPESYLDVKSAVTNDYQNLLEQEWVKQLRQTYPVTFNEEVIATIPDETK